jgi:hypothetical protein
MADVGTSGTHAGRRYDVGGVLLVLLLHELGQTLQLGPHVVEAVFCQTDNVGAIAFEKVNVALVFGAARIRFFTLFQAF